MGPGLASIRIGPALVRIWYVALLADGPGARTTAKCYRLLRAILNIARRGRPLWRQSLPHPSRRRGAGQRAAAAHGGGRVRARRRGQAPLPGARPGGRLHRLAPGRAVTEAVEALAAHLARFTGPSPADWVFTGDKGGPVRQGVWQHEWSRARASLGLAAVHFHDLRHADATLSAATGAGVKEIMYRIGHSSPQAALRYQHASARRDQRIAEGISELIRHERGEPRSDP